MASGAGIEVALEVPDVLPMMPEGHDGWYSVEPIEKPQIEEESGDPSIWTLFTKHTDDGDIWIRFPVEPQYIYTPEGHMVVTAATPDETFQMTIQPASGIGPETQDLHYSLDGKWVTEHHIRTNGQEIALKVVGERVENSNAEIFFSSFSIGKNG